MFPSGFWNAEVTFDPMLLIAPSIPPDTVLTREERSFKKLPFSEDMPPRVSLSEYAFFLEARCHLLALPFPVNVLYATLYVQVFFQCGLLRNTD